MSAAVSSVISGAASRSPHDTADLSDGKIGRVRGSSIGRRPLPKPMMGLPQLLGLFAVSFSYAFCFNTINSVVIPKEIERLAPSRQSMWVGLIMASGAISQLSTPMVGAWSDRVGNNRARFLVYGTILTVIGVSIYFFVSAMESIIVLFLAQIVTTVGLSTQYAMVTALLNDFVREEQTGVGSGAMAILAILGSGMGYALFALDVPVHYSYFSYILLSVFCLGVTVVHIPAGDIEGNMFELEDEPASSKKQHSGSPRAKRKQQIITFSSLLYESLSMPSFTKFPDFAYACLGRALFNAGLGGQVYLVYYLRDVMLVSNPVQVTSIVSVLALLGGIVGALPAGMLSDKIGKKPLIYTSILMCIGSLVLFMLVGNVELIQMVGFVYGIGNVGYLSVDYALGVQVLPRKIVTVEEGASEEHSLERNTVSVPIDAAKDLGVFAMSATVGQLVGQIIYGTVLDQFSGTSDKGQVIYNTGGFLVIYTISAAAFFMSAVSTGCIGITVK